MATDKIRYERELCDPLRRYLTDAGYTVRAEVNDCDLVAVKDDRLLIVEMKRHLSFDLLVQAVERQGYAEAVYVAIPKPAGFKLDKDWRSRVKVLRQLGLGLFLVSRTGDCELVEEAFAPTLPPEHPIPVRPAPKKRRALEKEFASRRLDLNTGGTRGVPLVTAYRESALQVAYLLDRHGPLTPKALRGLGSDPKRTAGILRLNPYGWFARGEGHCHALTDAGAAALVTYAPLTEAFRRQDELAAAPVARTMPAEPFRAAAAMGSSTSGGPSSGPSPGPAAGRKRKRREVTG